MANLNAADIKKGKVGANRLNNDRRVSAIIVSSPVIPLLAFKETVQFYGLFDAAQKGITEAFDKDNNVNVYRHVREFYRNAGEGVLLNFMAVPQTETLVSICQDTTNDKLKRLLIDSDFKVRQLAVALNPTVAGVPVDGLVPDVVDAISFAQGMAELAYNQFMPTHIFLEGYQLGGLSSVVPHLREIENVAATKVTMVIGQDWQYADTKTGIAQKFADVGTVLGVCAAAAINQNIGDNEAFNLMDAKKSAWMIPGLSSHQKNKEIFEQLQTFEDKGYVFGLSYAGLAGIRINNDHVCAPIIIDDEGNLNEHTIAYGRVMDDCARQLRTAYLPKIKKTYPVDDLGKLPTGVRVSLETIGDNIFNDMENAVEISGGKTTIDPDSDLLVAKELKVAFNVQPTGVLGYLNGTINLKSTQ
ncbi:DUF2586 family protein [Flavobacterium frigoris]|uniref:DUF2586 family protein n=1 Tax=Flavobacterium frigoris TaxID=229204 RepID=A0A1H9LMD6_FLAFI|nr:DUF2586 family protein [Flavobacterium frigoris]SER12053.1 hypothetical protein SAMN05444355_10765 [Flavobacterium frigoris]